MNQTLWGVLIGGLIGIIGSLIALIGNIASVKAETRRHLHRLGFELGIKEWELMHTHARELMARGALGGVVNPPLQFVYFNYRILEEMAKGRLTADSSRITKGLTQNGHSTAQFWRVQGNPGRVRLVYPGICLVAK